NKDFARDGHGLDAPLGETDDSSDPAQSALSDCTCLTIMLDVMLNWCNADTLDARLVAVLTNPSLGQPS
ncbi:MAG: hypothetical protein AB7G35_11260, partial [Hyphomicrobiaceae bacterium]